MCPELSFFLDLFKGNLYLSPLPIYTHIYNIYIYMCIYLDYPSWTSKLAILKNVFHCNKGECEKMVFLCRSIPLWHITVLIATWLSRSIATSRSSDLYLDNPIKKKTALLWHFCDVQGVLGGVMGVI